jgi:hypothetical protein
MKYASGHYLFRLDIFWSTQQIARMYTSQLTAVIDILKMRPIFKMLLILLTSALLSQCKKDEPDIGVKIPDNHFFNALVELGIDKNNDGIINRSEAEAITLLELEQKNISNMSGIEAFINLELLNCSNNLLTSLDVSNNTALIFLSVASNQLTALDISANTALNGLDCGDNKLSALNVSQNIALQYLSCYDNQLTSLDVSNNNELERMHCNRNKLSMLDVSGAVALFELGCMNNRLITLDVSNLPNLGLLYCEDNLLTTLNISNAPAIYVLDCSNNQLMTLDVTDNTSLYDLFIKKMPSLYKVCVAEMPYPFYAYTFGSPNVYFTTDCSK